MPKKIIHSTIIHKTEELLLIQKTARLKSALMQGRYVGVKKVIAESHLKRLLRELEEMKKEQETNLKIIRKQI